MLDRLLLVVLCLIMLGLGARAQFNQGGAGAGIGVGAVLSNGAPSNPTANATVTPLMMGLGTTCKITPAFSTRVLFQIQGNILNATAGNGSITALRTGTGTAPANGAAVTGTQQTAVTTHVSSGANTQTEFNHVSIVSGLTAGTAYWFDMQLASSAATSASITSITCQAAEL